MRAKDSERILKAARQQTLHIQADFSQESIEAKKQWDNGSSAERQTINQETYIQQDDPSKMKKKGKHSEVWEKTPKPNNNNNNNTVTIHH